MTSILQSLWRTLAAGFCLLILMVAAAILARKGALAADAAMLALVVRWLHVISAIMWLGLLLYFNFVQLRVTPTIQPVEHRRAVVLFIAPEALFWFRYAALVTVITGGILAAQLGYLPDALLLRNNVAIGIGMWLALIMAFNVWFVLWPRQKKVHGIVEATDEEKAQASRVILLVSRINLMLAVPMTWCMVAQQNGGL